MTKTEIKKPQAKLIGQDGNVFNLMGICSQALKKAGQRDKVKEMQERIFKSDEALSIMSDYCELY